MTKKRVALVIGGLLLVSFVASLLAGDTRDTRDIEGLIERLNTSQDPATCEAVATEAYLVQVTGFDAPFADEACERSIIEASPGSMSVREVEVAGDRAVATLDYEGGVRDGSSIDAEFVEQDGEWRINRLVEVDHLDRAAFEQGYREELLSPRFRYSRQGAECVDAAIGQLSDAPVEAFLLGANRPLVPILVKCDRPAVERNLLTGWGDPGPGYPPAVGRCFERRVSGLDDGELGTLLTDVPGIGRLLLGCDRDAVLGSFRRHLAGAGFEAPAVGCLIDRVRRLPGGEFAHLTYDDEAYAALVADCSD